MSIKAPYPDKGRDEKAAGIELQGVEAGAARGLGVEEGGRTAEGVE